MTKADIVERLRSNEPLPVCPYDRRSPDYWTAPDDKPCVICGQENTAEGPDLCRGADTRIMGEAAAEIERLRSAQREAFQKYVDANEALIDRKRQENEAFWTRRKAALQAFVNEFGAPDDGAIDECMAARPTSPLTSNAKATP